MKLKNTYRVPSTIRILAMKRAALASRITVPFNPDAPATRGDVVTHEGKPHRVISVWNSEAEAFQGRFMTLEAVA